MFRLALLCVTCVFVASTASAQVFYEPVQYQYGKGPNVYYYGGDDPRVHYYAMTPQGGAGRWGRTEGWAFASGNVLTHRAVSTEPTRTFTDAIPYMNATFYGYTAADARNEAYSRVPTYFRKSELLNAAVPVNNAWIVPAQAQPIRIDNDTVRYVPQPATAPRPLMVIPKDKLQPQQKSDKILASAASK